MCDCESSVHVKFSLSLLEAAAEVRKVCKEVHELSPGAGWGWARFATMDQVGGASRCFGRAPRVLFHEADGRWRKECGAEMLSGDSVT